MEINQIIVTAPKFCCRKNFFLKARNSAKPSQETRSINGKARDTVPVEKARIHPIFVDMRNPISSHFKPSGGRGMLLRHRNKEAALSHAEVISCPLLKCVAVYQWLSADKHLVGVYAQSFPSPADCWRYLPPGARWAHLLPFQHRTALTSPNSNHCLLHHLHTHTLSIIQLYI